MSADSCLKLYYTNSFSLSSLFEFDLFFYSNMSQNPALFIHLPKGVTQSEVERIIDRKDFGELESVSIQKNKNGHRNAIVRFSRWFRSAERVLNSLSRDGAITIVAGEFGDWKASVYVEPKRTVSVRKPNPKPETGKPQTRERRARSPVMTDESEIPKEIRDFIETCRIGNNMPEQRYVEVDVEQQVFYAPLPQQIYAPALHSYEEDDMEGLEEGEIFDYGITPINFGHYRNPGYYY